MKRSKEVFQKTKELTVTDLRLIKQAEFRMPFLPAAKWCYRAKALADRGLLKAIANGNGA